VSDLDSKLVSGLFHTPAHYDRTNPFYGAAEPAALSFSPVNLGPFSLSCVLGQGGMGVIYGGVHVALRVPVAVKVITKEGAEHRRFRTALVNEIQAVCALNHPAVVKVLDQGEIPDEAEVATNGELRAGTPYLVMEYVPRGTVQDIIGKVTWRQAKAILLTVLDGLAHAHAMDVIHRDIKPSNILLGDFGDRVIPKIADFGLAFATEDAAPLARAVGTPQYMAPEQISQPWRKHGAWSDLYALGCVAFELITGQRAFSGPTVREIINLHLAGNRREFRTILQVPPEFHDWLNRMLAIDPNKRFQSAAESAQALLALDDRSLRDVRPPEMSTLPIAAVTPVLDVFRSSGGELVAVSNVEQSLQEIPDRWMAPVLDRMPLLQVGAGLGVLGLRTIPLVGRLANLDIVWHSLRESDEYQQIRTIIVRAPEGTGRTRFGEAFVQRVRELGVATVLKVTHAAERGPTDGLSGMVARHFRTLGANPRDLQSAVQSELDVVGMTSAYDVQAMTALCDEANVGAKPSIEFSTVRQRHTLLISWLKHLSRVRPVLIWADDLQYSRETIEFLEMLAKDAEGARVMVLGAWSDNSLETNANEVFERNAETTFSTLDLQPLTSTEQRDLVQRIAPLEPEITLEICERTAGNPRFMVEMIGDWVARGLFEVSSAGFRLKAGAEATIPLSLEEVWHERITAFTSTDPAIRVALELAAALGFEVYDEEWEAVCQMAGLKIDSSLVSQLVKRSLVTRTETGWRFHHISLRHTLETMAKDAGRWTRHNQLCARVLSRGHTDRVDIAERLGRYLISGGESAEALPHLWVAAEIRRRTGAFVEAQQDISWIFRGIEALGGIPDERQLAEATAFRARTYLNASEPRHALDLADEAHRGALEAGWDDILIASTIWRAMAKQMLGEPGAAADIEEAHALTLATSTPLKPHTYTSLAFVLSTQRRLGEALEILNRANSVTTHDRAFELQHRSRLAVLMGDWEAVLKHGPAALQALEELGHFQAMTSVMEYLAEAHRKQGALAEAKTLLTKCVELQSALGSPTLFSKTNLGSVALALNRFEEAEGNYLQALHEARAVGRRAVVVCALGGLMATAAGLQRWGQVRDLTTTARIELGSAMVPEADLAVALDKTGDLLAKAELMADAAAAYDLAIAVYHAAGNLDAMEATKEKCSSLDLMEWDFPISSEIREDS